MKRHHLIITGLVCGVWSVCCSHAGASLPPGNDFDLVMTHVGSAVIWRVIDGYDVLPPGFSLAPATSDINGGLDSSQTPVIMYPNGILDSDEFALMSAICTTVGFDARAWGGTCQSEMLAAWEHNYALVYQDLGGGVGGPEVLLPPDSMIPDVEYLFCAFMTIGDSDSLSFPLTIMDLVVNNELVFSLFGDPNLRMPDPDAYQRMYRYIGWCGDADGDGCNNLTEYEYFYPRGGRSAYIQAAMNHYLKPPDCAGDDLICDDTGGLLGEYYNESNLTNLGLTRVDSVVAFDWGAGSPDPAIEPDSFSVRWSGWVTPTHTETYTFYARTDDGVRLWVNAEPLITDWTNHGRQEFSGTIPLVAGERYAIRMEYFETGGDANAWLGWSSASQRKQVLMDMYTTPRSDVPETDWIRNPANGHYYKITPTLTWLEAKALAAGPAPEWGGYLVTINDAAENAWIRETFGTYYGNLLIGANDYGTEGVWTWDENGQQFWSGKGDGTVVAPYTYTNWNTDEPNDSGNNEDAGQLYASTGLWNDIGPAYTARAVVETGTGRINYAGPTPNTATVQELGNVSFSVTVRQPVAPVTYRWRKDGADLPAKAGFSSTYTVYDAKLSDTGGYSCVIEDATGATVETPEAFLTVNAGPPMPVAGGLGLALLAGLCAVAAGRRARRCR